MQTFVNLSTSLAFPWIFYHATPIRITIKGDWSLIWAHIIFISQIPINSRLSTPPSNQQRPTAVSHPVSTPSYMDFYFICKYWANTERSLCHYAMSLHLLCSIYSLMLSSVNVKMVMLSKKAVELINGAWLQIMFIPCRQQSPQMVLEISS